MNTGIPFERTVERWLVKQHGAYFTERRAKQRGRVAAHAHECDVHAKVGNDLWHVSALVCAFCVVSCVGAGIAQEPLAVIAAGLLGICSLVATMTFLFDPKHIWVEVKSGEGTITRATVWKLVNQVEDVRENPTAAWYPHQAWLVSSAPLDRDALAFAREHGVRVFVELQRGELREVG